MYTESYIECNRFSTQTSIYYEKDHRYLGVGKAQKNLAPTLKES